VSKLTDAAIAYLDRIDEWAQLPPDLRGQQPNPPSPEVADELAAASATAMAVVLEYLKTGTICLDPPIEARSAVSDLLDSVLEAQGGPNRIHGAVEETLFRFLGGNS
jgi:hypothetical protein